MKISPVQNSFNGQLYVRGKLSPDDQRKYVTWFKMGIPSIESTEDYVKINTDCIASISPKRITVLDNPYRRNDTFFVEIDQSRTIPYDQLLAAYTAACQNDTVQIHATID